MTTDQFAAFPDAPAPKTLAEAQDLIETTVRLIGKEGGRPANLPRPETLVDALDHLEAQRQVLADLLREKSTQTMAGSFRRLLRNLRTGAGKSIGATVKARAGGDDEVVWTDDDIA